MVDGVHCLCMTKVIFWTLLSDDIKLQLVYESVASMSHVLLLDLCRGYPTLTLKVNLSLRRQLCKEFDQCFCFLDDSKHAFGLFAIHEIHQCWQNFNLTTLFDVLILPVLYIHLRPWLPCFQRNNLDTMWIKVPHPVRLTWGVGVRITLDSSRGSYNLKKVFQVQIRSLVELLVEQKKAPDKGNCLCWDV